MVKKETEATVSLEDAFLNYVGSTQAGVLSYS